MEIQINNEQLLELALNVTTGSDDIEEDDPLMSIAHQILGQYIAITYPEIQTAEEAQMKLIELETNYILQTLVKKNMIEAEFDEFGTICYSPTEAGKTYVRDHQDEMD